MIGIASVMLLWPFRAGGAAPHQAAATQPEGKFVPFRRDIESGPFLRRSLQSMFVFEVSTRMNMRCMSCVLIPGAGLDLAKPVSVCWFSTDPVFFVWYYILHAPQSV